MIRYFYQLSTLIFIIVRIPAQEIEVDDVNINYMPQGYILQSLNGVGVSGNQSATSANISSCNPALLNKFNSVTCGISYQFDSVIEKAWILLKETGHKRINTVLPQSAGIVIPFGNVRVGLGLNQVYNSERINDPMHIILYSYDYPEGRDTTIHFIDKTLILKYSTILSYGYKSIFITNDQVSIALQINLIDNYKESSFYFKDYDASFSGYNWTLGLHYKCDIGLYQNLQIGAYYEKGFYSRHPYDTLDVGLLPYFEIGDLQYFSSKLPDKLNVGIGYNFSKRWRIFHEFSYILLETISGDSFASHRNIKNQIELSSGIINGLNDRYSVSFGFHYTDRNYNEEVNEHFDDDFKAIFLTTGLMYNSHKNYDFEIIIADSHFFSDRSRKQTIMKTIIGLRL